MSAHIGIGLVLHPQVLKNHKLSVIFNCVCLSEWIYAWEILQSDTLTALTQLSL